MVEKTTIPIDSAAAAPSGKLPCATTHESDYYMAWSEEKSWRTYERRSLSFRCMNRLAKYSVNPDKISSAESSADPKIANDPVTKKAITLMNNNPTLHQKDREIAKFTKAVFGFEFSLVA